MINRIANYQKFFTTKKSGISKGIVAIIQAASTDNLD